MKNNQYIRRAQYKKGFANILIVLAVVALLGVVGYFAWSKKSNETIQNTNPVTTSPVVKNLEPKISTPIIKDETTGWKTYTNKQYEFEFKYPLDYSLEVIKDYKGSDYDFKLISPTKETLFIGREDNRFSEDTFEKFSLDRSKKYCDADGHDESVYCSNENKKIVFTNPANIVSYEIYLNETTENYTMNQKTTRIRGPIFVLDFSPLKNPEVRGIFFNREDTFSEREIIVQILSTFKFTK